MVIKVRGKEQKIEITVPAMHYTLRSESKDLKRKKVDMKPMDEEEAIMQMEMLGHSFFVFKNAETNNICVLYLRKDGNYGIIETN